MKGRRRRQSLAVSVQHSIDNNRGLDREWRCPSFKVHNTLKVHITSCGQLEQQITEINVIWLFFKGKGAGVLNEGYES